MKPTATNRTQDRDAIALTHIKAYGKCTMREVMACLYRLDSFAGSTSVNSMETSTRASIKRLEVAGLVEHVGMGGARETAKLYAAKGES